MDAAGVSCITLMHVFPSTPFLLLFLQIMSAISNFVVAVLLGFTASVVYEKPVVWIWETATRSRKTPKLLKGGQRGTTVAESLQNSTNGEIKKEAV